MNQPQTATTFEPLNVLSARALALPGSNTDTDQIIPARFLKKDRAQGYGQYLFHDARFDEGGQPKTHPLNAANVDTPKILVVEHNFGCGSSREGAVYALADYGIRVLIGITFGDIFHNNCFKNGLLPIRLTANNHQQLMQWLADQGQAAFVTVDLNQCQVRWAAESAGFDVDPFWRECLTKGLDELSLTLSYGEQIDRFESSYGQQFPWLMPSRTRQI